MKKALLVLVLAVQFGGILGAISSQAPWPDCRKCPVTFTLQ